MTEYFDFLAGGVIRLCFDYEAVLNLKKDVVRPDSAVRGEKKVSTEWVSLINVPGHRLVTTTKVRRSHIQRRSHGAQ